MNTNGLNANHNTTHINNIHNTHINKYTTHNTHKTTTHIHTCKHILIIRHIRTTTLIINRHTHRHNTNNVNTHTNTTNNTHIY